MMRSNNARTSILPIGTLPRGLNREQSAEYIGVSATKFDQTYCLT